MIRKGYAAKTPFSPAEAQEEGLLAAAAKAEVKLPVYVDGRGAETLTTCLKAYRDEPGELWVFGGYRIFGGGRAAIIEVIKDLKRRRLIVVDKMNNERSDLHGEEMLARAEAQIAGQRKIGDRKRARKMAQKGAATRAANNQAAKDRILAADIQKRLGEAPELSWRRKAEILGEPWTASSLFRAYGKKPKSK